jgi:maltooligosyltrehalose trehalohydrolase
VSVKIGAGGQSRESYLTKDQQGYFEGTVKDAQAGDRYVYRLDDKGEYPDPASRFQPEGVHGPSQVVDPTASPWEDEDWRGTELSDFIIYELHVGTFTADGTFEAIIPYLGYMKELGITALELMPVAQFPGTRNWGYDGVYPYAPQNSYGGPYGLKKLINACHKEKISVVLDVVYNHLGPEGNYLANFGPYFTDRYRTPWGDAINFDGPFSDDVRSFFISNALYWITEYHIDALRIDAIHGIFDFGAYHFLRELGEAVHDQARRLRKNIYLIPESDLNDVRVINPILLGGFGLDAQWNDDFHHALHTLLTSERDGYYQDFGSIDDLAKALREGFVYSGQYSKYRKRRHGSSSSARPAHQFVVFSQNHDQVGNRPWGDRLAADQSLEKLKLASGVVLLSPYLPLLFMGEEYGETAPFLYFVSHSDPTLIEAVRRGRQENFSSFAWKGELPDPQAEETFMRSRISLDLCRHGQHGLLFSFYRKLIRLRRETPAFKDPSTGRLEVHPQKEKQVILLRSRSDEEKYLVIYSFGEKVNTILLPVDSGTWRKILESSSETWGGPGEQAEASVKCDKEPALFRLSPHSVTVYQKRE